MLSSLATSPIDPRGGPARSASPGERMGQQIAIKLAPATLAALKGLGYALYIMRLFDKTNAQGKALVWLTTTRLEEATSIDFDAVYQAYVSTTQMVGNAVVTVSSSAPVDLGMTATVGSNMQIAVTRGGNPDGVTIVNGVSTPYTTGLMARAIGGDFAPIFAEPLYGLAADIAAPLDQFLLTFSTQGVAPGALIEHAVSQSLLVDLSGVLQRAVVFDINNGWSAGGAAWAKPVPAGADLTPVLVHERPLKRA